MFAPAEDHSDQHILQVSQMIPDRNSSHDPDDWEDDALTDSTRPKSPSRSRRRGGRRRIPPVSASRTLITPQRKKTVLVPAPPALTPGHAAPPPPSLLDMDALSKYLHAATVFCGDILIGSLKLLKYPFTLFITVYILALLTARAYVAVTTPIVSLVSVLCEVPVVSLLANRFCGTQASVEVPTAMRPDYPRLMEIETSSFEKLLDNSLSNSDLVLNLKKAEMASSDLNTLLLVSDLAIKTQLSSAVAAFAQEARLAGRSLQRFDAKIQGTIDQVIAFNEYILKMTRDARRTGLLSGSASLVRTALLLPSKEGESLAFMFDQVMSMLESHLARLLADAQTILSHLDALEERLGGIHMLISTESASIGKHRHDLLAELWTVLGGNRRQLKKYERHSELLGNIDVARQRALAHVVAAVTTLETTQASLEELRERASMPGLAGFEVPIEAQVLSVRSAMERLTLSRESARASQAQIGSV